MSSSVAVKHYLRGEEGINYVDLYHLVKFLPSYAFPEGIPRNMEDQCVESTTNLKRTTSRQSHQQNGTSEEKNSYDSDEKPHFMVTPATAQQSATDLPLPPSPSIHASSVDQASTRGNGNSGAHVKLELPHPVTTRRKPSAISLARPGMRASTSSRTGVSVASRTPTKASYGFSGDEPVELLPAAMPPKYSIFDVFPFSLLIKFLERSGRGVEGKKAARYRAKSIVVTRNVPLEVSMYLVNKYFYSFLARSHVMVQTSYISNLQARKVIDPPTSSERNFVMFSTLTELNLLKR